MYLPFLRLINSRYKYIYISSQPNLLDNIIFKMEYGELNLFSEDKHN